jgi:putative transposase
MANESTDYIASSLNLPSKSPRRHVLAARRIERSLASRPNDISVIEFVPDALPSKDQARSITQNLDII